MWLKVLSEHKHTILNLLHSDDAEIRCFDFAEFSMLFCQLAENNIPANTELLSPKSPYVLADRAIVADQVQKVAGIPFSDKSFYCIAGPCAVESWSQLAEVADCLTSSGTLFMRAGAFKPRTSPYAFQGLADQGLALLARVKAEFGLRIVTEVMTIADIDKVSAVADVLQIGSRNMHNTALLKAVGQQSKPVLLKRGLAATYEEFLLAAEYILFEGNLNVILCERGIRSFQDKTRNVLDLAGVALLKRLTHLPVIVDPSHATGLANLVPTMSLAALVVGANGLIVEIHPEPAKSISDAEQAINLATYQDLIMQLQRYAAVDNRLLNCVP